MKKIFLLISIVSLSALLAFSSRFGQQNPDQQFVTKAADGGMLEVKLGELASKKGQAPKVKDFAKTMINDHTKVNNELKSVAEKKQIQVPAALSKMSQAKYDSLNALQGEKFDMLYMNMMIASHEQTIGLFQTESNKGKDAELKKWADSKIPALKHHLEMAKQLFKTSPAPHGSAGH
jgi:putative membrane protein